MVVVLMGDRHEPTPDRVRLATGSGLSSDDKLVHGLHASAPYNEPRYSNQRHSA